MGKNRRHRSGFVYRQAPHRVASLLLGHQFDRGFAERYAGAGDTNGTRRSPLSEHFISALFQTMGHLSKADGRVTEEEIRAARALMHRLNLGPAQIRRAIECFDQGKAQSFPLLATIQRLRRQGARTADDRRLFVRLLTEVAVSKPVLHQRERTLLWEICRELDIGRVEMAQLEAMLRAQRAFRGSPAGAADAARVDDAYAVLGIDKSSTNEEIKTAYRRLMNKHHPDKMAGQDREAADVAGRRETHARHSECVRDLEVATPDTLVGKAAIRQRIG